MGRRFKREGTLVYLWLIHVDVWQKPSQYCKVFILQLKRIDLVVRLEKGWGLSGCTKSFFSVLFCKYEYG